MKTDKKEKNIDSILKVTKNVIQSTRNYNNYYINQKDNFYIDQLPLLTSPNSVNHSLSEEITKDEDYKTIRKAHIRSNKIPKLCPLYNEKGELLKKVAPSSKINIRNLYLNQLNIKDILAIDPFFIHQRYKYYGTLGNAFEEFLRDIFFGKKYSDLIYDEKEIFDNDNYLKYINEKIEELKNENNIDENTLLECNYLFWKNKKKMNISINSLNISFEEVNKEQSNNKKFEVSLPFSLLPIFYVKDEEIFKKILSSFLKFDEQYEKAELNYENIYIYLRKNDNFTENKIENVINDIEELQKDNLNNSLDEIINEQKENEIYLTEPQNQKINNQNNNQNNNTNNIDNMDKEDEYKKNTYNIYPFVLKSSNFLKYNSFQFFWSTPNGKLFKVLINLPLINFTIPSNSIKVQQFLDHKLLFYIMEKNFENWDFYIVNYLASFKRFRILLENLASHIPINFVQFYLKTPRIKFYSFNNWELANLYTNDKRINSLLVFKPIYAYVTIINNNFYWMDKYIIHFNFDQMIKFFKIEKYLNKVLFFIKFLDIYYEDNTVNYNYEELDNFNVENWVNDVKKFNIGEYFNENEEKNDKKEIEFLGNTPNIRIKIEIKESRVITTEIEHGKDEKKCYFIPYDIQKELSEENFFNWSFIIPKIISKENEYVPGQPVVIQPKKKLKSKTLYEPSPRTSYVQKSFTKTKENDDKIKLKLKNYIPPIMSKVRYIIENLPHENRKDEVIEVSKSNKMFDIMKGKKGVKFTEEEMQLPIINRMKVVIYSDDEKKSKF